MLGMVLSMLLWSRSLLLSMWEGWRPLNLKSNLWSALLWRGTTTEAIRGFLLHWRQLLCSGLR